MKFKPNEKTHFKLDSDEILVKIENSKSQFAFRISMNGKKSEVLPYHVGLIVFEGYGLATGAWTGTFEEFIPFKINYTESA